MSATQLCLFLALMLSASHSPTHVQAQWINVIPPSSPSPSPPPPQAALCRDDNDEGPYRPRNLRVTGASRTTADVCFDAPQYPSTCPTRYDVRYTPVVQVQPLGAAAAGLAEAGRTVELPPGLQITEGGCFSLDNLQSGTTYDLSVQAIREVGWNNNDLQGETATTQFTTSY